MRYLVLVGLLAISACAGQSAARIAAREKAQADMRAAAVVANAQYWASDEGKRLKAKQDAEAQKLDDDRASLEERHRANEAAYAAKRNEFYRQLGSKPSDIAECRSRANAAFGTLSLKESIQDDCLTAISLRRRGL